MSPHLDLNASYKKETDKEKKKREEKEEKEEKDNYIKLIESHLVKKGTKKYWSNIGRKSDTNNDLI